VQVMRMLSAFSAMYGVKLFSWEKNVCVLFKVKLFLIFVNGRV
jgi:hypothetical protein